jgi:hypothetical protein
VLGGIICILLKTWIYFLQNFKTNNLTGNNISNGGSASNKMVRAGKYLPSPIIFTCHKFIVLAKGCCVSVK